MYWRALPVGSRKYATPEMRMEPGTKVERLTFSRCYTEEVRVETTHFEKRKWRQKRANFVIFSRFLIHMLISMQFIVISAPSNWYMMDFRLEKSHFAKKNMLSETFSGGYPVWKCELWLDLTYKTQKHNSAGCDHELHIVGEQPTD